MPPKTGPTSPRPQPRGRGWAFKQPEGQPASGPVPSIMMTPELWPAADNHATRTWQPWSLSLSARRPYRPNLVTGISLIPLHRLRRRRQRAGPYFAAFNKFGLRALSARPASSLGGTLGAVASPRAADCGHVTPAAPRRKQPPPYPSSCQCSVSFAFRREHRNTTIRSTWLLLVRWCLALLRRSRSHTVDAVVTVSSTEAAFIFFIFAAPSWYHSLQELRNLLFGV